MSKLRKFLIGDLSWKRIAYSILSIYLMLLVVAVFFAHKLIFFPPSERYDESLSNLTLYGDGNGGKIAAVHYPASEGMPTILWSHGNAEDISQLADVFRELNNSGIGVFAYDYPGYGLSSGTPKEKTLYRAADTTWQHLTQELGIPEEQLIILGQSIGSGPAVYLASQHKPACVILLAPLTSVYRVGLKYPIFPCDQFPNIKRIENVTAPLLVIHGEKDSVIPQKHGKALIAKHKGENQFISLSKTDHNDIYFRNFDQVIAEITQFARQHHSLPE